MTSYGQHPREKEPSKDVAALVAQVETDGGIVLAVYREPGGDHSQIFALLPRERVEPTPYQRDLSPTHAKRLFDVVKRLDRFVDPMVAVSPKPGLYWTPNGNHRLAALTKLKVSRVPAILTPLTRARKTLPSFEQTFTKLVAAIRGFDLSKVRYEDVQRSAVFAAPAGD